MWGGYHSVRGNTTEIGIPLVLLHSYGIHDLERRRDGRVVPIQLLATLETSLSFSRSRYQEAELLRLPS
jgi:hypothetical protein